MHPYESGRGQLRFRKTHAGVYIYDFPDQLFYRHNAFMSSKSDRFTYQVLKFGIIEVRARAEWSLLTHVLFFDCSPIVR